MNIKLILFIITFAFSACSKADGDLQDPNDNVNNDDKDVYLPIVMIHGALASGDTYAKPSMLFSSNAYPEDLLFTFDWNTLGGNTAANVQKLDDFIDKVLLKSDSDKLILIAHSAGGGLAYSYCNDDLRVKKIAKYIHVGSSAQSALPGPGSDIPTMNIYSTADRIVAGGDIPNATNVVFSDLDHYEVATSEMSFAKIYEFITGKAPVHLEILPLSDPYISGRVVTLGENLPPANVNVEIFYVDSKTAERKGAAVHTFQPDTDGYFGPFTVSNTEYLEFEITSATEGFRTLHYYREPTKRNNTKVYLRTFPPSTSLAGILLSSLPRSDDQAVIAVFSANQAIIHERDELVVQGLQLSNATLCRPENSTIAMFLYDNGDKQSSGNPHAAFSFAPFLRGADVFFSTEEPEAIPLFFNGRTITVRNYKSDSEGVIIAVFD